MTPAHVVQFETPKGVLLHGLWFGPKKPKRTIVLVHGLTSSAFSVDRVHGLVDKETAVLSFNNRGYGVVNQVKQVKGIKTTYILAGSAHELFTDCVDDIEGALSFARAQGVRQLYLAGHSTGCQKSVYFASRGNTRNLKGIILLAPISDYASQKWMDRNGALKKGVALARRLVRAGRPHELMPKELSGVFPCDARRFLSLYTPESVEEVFPYAHARTPKALRSITTPILLVLAGKDEYSDRSATKIAEWFSNHTQTLRIDIIPDSNHFFKKKEKQLTKVMRRFLEETTKA